MNLFGGDLVIFLDMYRYCMPLLLLDSCKEASAVPEILRRFNENYSLFMAMVGLMMFNVDWVEFEIESII